MKAVRGQWMLVTFLWVGLPMTAMAEGPNHNGNSGTPRPYAGQTPQQVFNNTISACALGQGAGVGPGFAAALPIASPPPPSPPPAVFPPPGDDILPSDDTETSPTGSAETPKSATASTRNGGTPPVQDATVRQSDVIGIMSKVNCNKCHGDGRVAADYSPQELAQKFADVAKMRAALPAGEVAKLESWIKAGAR